MSAASEQEERLRKLKERRAAASEQPRGVRAKPKGRKRHSGAVTRGVTGGISLSAFVAVTAAMGPVFAADDEAPELEVALQAPTTTWLPPTTTAPAPVLPEVTTVPPPAPVAPTTIVVVRREYLVTGSNVPVDPGAPPAARPARTPGPSPASSPTPTAAPVNRTPTPVTTAAPPPPPPTQPPPPPAAPPVTSGS